MSINITAERVRVGDKIRVTEEFVVTKITPSPSDGRIWYQYLSKDGDIWEFAFTPHSTIELLNRKTEDLPTEKGAVIRVFSNSGEGRWMLTETEHGGFPVWVSTAGIRNTPGELFNLIDERSDRSFEVIA